MASVFGVGGPFENLIGSKAVPTLARRPGRHAFSIQRGGDYH